MNINLKQAANSLMCEIDRLQREGGSTKPLLRSNHWQLPGCACDLAEVRLILVSAALIHKADCNIRRHNSFTGVVSMNMHLHMAQVVRILNRPTLYCIVIPIGTSTSPYRSTIIGGCCPHPTQLTISAQYSKQAALQRQRSAGMPVSVCTCWHTGPFFS